MSKFKKENKKKKKTDLIKSALRQITLQAQSGDSIDDSIEVFLDRGYNAGGSNPITDEDLVDFGITLAEFVEIKTFIDNYNLFLDNGSPAQADYRKTLNVLRTDK